MKRLFTAIALSAAALLTACGGGEETQACFKLQSTPKQYFRTFVEDCSTGVQAGDYTKMVVKHRTADGKIPAVLTSPYDGYGPVPEQSFVSFNDFVDIKYCIVRGTNPVEEISCVEETFKVEK